MPRIRTIKPKFWDDIKLSKISRDARLLFIGIWNFSDDLGVIVAEPVWIKSKVFPYDKLDQDQLENWLKELIGKKFIIPITYQEELFFYIRTFDRHQQINKPNHSDICIDKQVLSKIIEQSRNNHGTITDLERIYTEPLQGGKEGKGKEGKGREPEHINPLHGIYQKSWLEYSKILNGQSKSLTEQKFDVWKEFVDFIYERDFTDLFASKFISPIDFDKIVSDGFTRDKWEIVLKKILSTGVKPEHNLFFRIPEFIGYSEKGKLGNDDLSEYEKKLNADREKYRTKKHE